MFNFNTTRRRGEGDTYPAADRAEASRLPGVTEASPETLNVDARVNELELQVRDFMLKNPDFDMKAELENPKFVEYLFKNGLSVEDAFFLVHRNELVDDAVNRAVGRINFRRNRIQENGTAKSSPASVKKNPGDMSDKEIADIIERVRNGEKISF